MEDKRKGIEMKLKEFSKLGRWEISPSYDSVEKSKHNRQKVKDLIEKYTVSIIVTIVLFLSLCNYVHVFILSML